jgi:hypothetical protein
MFGATTSVAPIAATPTTIYSKIPLSISPVADARLMTPLQISNQQQGSTIPFIQPGTLSTPSVPAGGAFQIPMLPGQESGSQEIKLGIPAVAAISLVAGILGYLLAKK